MPKSRLLSLLVFGVAFALTALGCSTDTQPTGETGSLSLDLTLDGFKIDEVHWEITGGDKGGYERAGDINTTNSGNNGGTCDELGDERVCVRLLGVDGIPEDTNYLITMTATSTDEQLTCEGKATFDIIATKVTAIHVTVNCNKPRETGSVWVDGWFNICAQLEWAVISPLEVEVDHDIDLESDAFDEEGDSIRYLWESAFGLGSIADPGEKVTTYTCNEVGSDLINLTVSDDDFMFCLSQLTAPVPVECVPGEIECLENIDCNDGNQCTINVCADGRCVDSDSPAGDGCIQDDGSMCDGEGNCVQCNNELDCDVDETCVNGWCILAPDCTDDIDCTDGNQCTINVCAEGTCIDTDADPGDTCDEGGGTVCDGAGACVECTEKTDCGAEETCVANACVSDPDLFCNEGICAINEEARLDCVDAFLTCLAGEPINEEECIFVALIKCNECNEDSDCDTGEFCNDNKVCEPMGEIPLPMVVDDHYFGRSGFSDGAGGEPLHEEDNDCPQRAGDENGLCHRFTWNGMGGAFTGTFWTDGEGFVDLNGLPVEGGATEVSFYAWGAAGGEVITFGAGIGDAELDGAEARRLITLTTAPTLYTVSLAALAGYTDVYGPFIWAADTTGNPSGFEFYVDDIQWIQGEIPTLGPIDFEPGGLGAGFTWAVFENVDNPPLEFITNPDPTGANTSATVAKFTARLGGQPFAGTITQDLPTFTLNASNSCVKIKVWKSVVSDVGLKFEMGAASTGEIKVANTVTDQWEELTFDFSVKIGEPSSTDITGFVVFPDFATRTQENVIYFDDIVFLDSGECP